VLIEYSLTQIMMLGNWYLDTEAALSCLITMVISISYW